MKTQLMNYDEGLLEDLRVPVEAAAYLNAALDDGAQDVFLLALRDVAKAHGISRVARETALNRENMYRILSEEGNPQLSSLKLLLDSLDLKLAIEPKRNVA